MKKLLFISLLSFAISIKSQNKVLCEKALASYYHDKFEGRKCSSGQIFRQDGLTAAHRTLKFGTRVKITNLKNDSCVIVTINDRMPNYGKCEIDLTLRAARQLNFVKQGIAKVKIEVLKD